MTDRILPVVDCNDVRCYARQLIAQHPRVQATTVVCYAFAVASGEGVEDVA